MAFSEILIASGGYGVYQYFLTFGCLALSLVAVSFAYWTQVFILLIPPHRCKIYHNDTQWFSSFNDTNGIKSDQCNLIINGSQASCSNGIIYDFSLNFQTYASEHDMVCENAWKVYLIHTIYWIGTIFGSILFGIVSDRLGRKRAYQCSTLLTLTSDVTTYFCEQHIPFVIARFFSAAGEGSIGTMAFLLAIEHTIPSKRRFNIFVWSLAYAIGSLAIVWLAYFVYNWRYILMIAWIPSSIAIILSYFIPESPSWLVTRGRIDEAVESVQRMARINGRSLDKDFIIRNLKFDDGREKKNVKQPEKMKSDTTENVNETDIETEEEEMSCSETFFAVLKSPTLRNRIICLAALWSISCACYNGNNLEFSYLPFNMYITYSLGALSEIPGNILVMFTLDRFGRRWTNSFLYIAGGIFGILSSLAETKFLIITLVLFMRMFYASSFDLTFSMSSEIIPTVIRGRTLSFIRTCGGMGSAMAPFVVNLSEQNALLPLLCFGVAAITGGLLMLTLPETAHKHLPQTIEEGENYGKDQSFWYCPFIKNSTQKKEEQQNCDLKASCNMGYEMEEKEV